MMRIVWPDFWEHEIYRQKQTLNINLYREILPLHQTYILDGDLVNLLVQNCSFGGVSSPTSTVVWLVASDKKLNSDSDEPKDEDADDSAWVIEERVGHL